GRNLVGRRRVGHDPAAVGPPQLFGGQPADTLNETAFDLTHVDRRTQRAADVVDDVDGGHFVFAGQRIDQHFRAGDTVGEVLKRPAAAEFVDFELGRGEKAGGRQMN